MKKLWRHRLFCWLLTSCAWAAHWERDDAGRSVAVPDQVHRVVMSLSPSLTNTVYALGAQADLVGITDYTVYPPEAAREKPSVGAVVNPSLEKIVALHPDLVLALPEFNGAETIAGLERWASRYFCSTPAIIANIYRSVEAVGRVHGTGAGSERADRQPARAREQGPRPVHQQGQTDGAAGAVDRSADYRRQECVHHGND